MPWNFALWADSSESVIDKGHLAELSGHAGKLKRKKGRSKKFRDAYGHTPVSVEEKIPWKCQQLVIGTGTGASPIMPEVKREAKRRKIKLLVLPTAEAIEALKNEPSGSNAILHVTC